MNATQSNLLLELSANGWIIKKISMIGEKLWIQAEKPRADAKNTLLDESLFGTIGQRGKIEMEYSQFTYREKVTERYILNHRITGK